MLISFDFHFFYFNDPALKDTLKTHTLLLYPFLFVLLLQLALHLLITFSSTSLSFIISCCPSSPPSELFYLVHLPHRTKVRVRGQLPGRTTEPVLKGVLMYLPSILSFCFISPDNSFPQEMASLSPTATRSLHIYMCVHDFPACMSVLACVGGCFSVSSSPLPAPFTHPCLFALLSFLVSSSLPCLTFFSLCLSSSIDSQS